MSDFVKAVAIRAIRTFAQGMLGALGTTVAGATAAIISVLMAVAGGLPEAGGELPEAVE